MLVYILEDSPLRVIGGERPRGPTEKQLPESGLKGEWRQKSSFDLNCEQKCFPSPTYFLSTFSMTYIWRWDVRAAEGAARSKTKLPTSKDAGRKVPLPNDWLEQDPGCGTRMVLINPIGSTLTLTGNLG